jgi:hypothetical protein
MVFIEQKSMLFTGLGKTVPLIYTSLMSEGTGIIIPPTTTIGKIM